MVVKLKSVSTSQTLRLAFKAFALALILFWLRSRGFTVGISVFFLSVFTLFYARPSLGNTKFLPSGVILAVAPFFVTLTQGLPEALFAAGWGVIFFLLLSTKNLLLPQRQGIYRVVHYTIVVVLNLILIDRFGFTSQAVVFVAMLFVFREFYIRVIETGNEQRTLIAALEAFTLIEIAWVLSFLSVGVFISSAFLTLFVFIFHDTVLLRMKGTLNKQTVVRNGVIFAVLVVLLITISVGDTLF